MKLSEWARKQGINYKTAWKWYKEGKLPVPAYQTPTGTILVKVGEEKEGGKAAIYARVSSADQKADLDRQVVRLPVPVVGEPAGIDVGLNHFAVLSTGEKIGAPKSLEKDLKKLRRLSRQHSRKQKGSNNRKKSALKLARLHRKIKNQRKDFLHKLSSELAKTSRLSLSKTYL